jgi:hypothetical protein
MRNCGEICASESEIISDELKIIPEKKNHGFHGWARIETKNGFLLKDGRDIAMYSAGSLSSFIRVYQ